MPLPALYQIHYSPWSEKARWALDARCVAYRKVEYLPMLGAPMLRARLGRWSGKVTVPVLFASGQAHDDSLAIAQWAAGQGTGPELFPIGRATELLAWNRASEAVLAHGRALVTPRVAGDPSAALEQVPKGLRWLGPLSAPLVALGVRYLRDKYALEAVGQNERRSAMRAELTALRQALASGAHLLGAFSYADIAMAVALQVVEPVGDGHQRLGPATRAAWREPELADEFADLIAWRDRLYDRFRRPTDG
ncbi:MAG: glutathione S-transferase N-terminal domain-containing protein [Deltaproteobacteria bacterium]|nr:glutathione S-transferase N-terminal domain-containing protein [Deltaproteobacteria bacterium]